MARKGKRTLAFDDVPNVYVDLTGYEIQMMVRGERGAKRYPLTTTKTKLAAEAAAMRTHLGAVADKREAGQSKPGTLRKDFDAFLAGWSGKDKRPISDQLNHWCVALGAQTQRKHITSQHVREAIARWQREPQASNYGKPYARETVIKLLRTLRQVWRVLDGSGAANPANEVETPATPKPIARAMRFDEAEAIIYGMRPSYSRACLKLQLHLGIMAIEIKRLHKADIDWKRGTIKISRRQKGAGSHERVLPFGLIDAARDALVEYASYDRWATKGHELQWPTNNLNQMFQKYAERFGIAQGCRAYDLRHTCGTELYRRNGGSIRAVQKWLGHEKVETTMRYILGGDDDQLIASAQAMQAHHVARAAAEDRGAAA